MDALTGFTAPAGQDLGVTVGAVELSCAHRHFPTLCPITEADV
jgi:hypothetical protein